MKFHQCADDKGSAIVVCLARSGAIFGGYNRTSKKVLRSKRNCFLHVLVLLLASFSDDLLICLRSKALGWRSTDDYSASSNAWLWFQQNNKSVKVPILQGGNAAVFDYATGGPCFGSADLMIGSPQAAVMGGFAGTFKIYIRVYDRIVYFVVWVSNKKCVHQICRGSYVRI